MYKIKISQRQNKKKILIKLSTQHNKPPQFTVYCLTTIIDKASHKMSKSLNINNTIDQASHTMSKLVGVRESVHYKY